MNWDIISAIATGVCALLALAKIQRDIADLKTHIETSRRKDREELMAWINGSFMRSREALQRLDTIVKDVEHIDQHGCSRFNGQH